MRRRCWNCPRRTRPNGRPLRAGHLGIVPMAFAGYPHADGRVFGFAVEPEGRTALGDVPGFRAAFEKIAPYDAGIERRVLQLPCIPDQPMLLSPAGGEASKRSLKPARLLKPVGTDPTGAFAFTAREIAKRLRREGVAAPRGRRGGQPGGPGACDLRAAARNRGCRRGPPAADRSLAGGRPARGRG